MRLRRIFFCLAVLALLVSRPVLAADDAAKDAKADKPAASDSAADRKDDPKKDPDWIAKGSKYSPEGCEFEIVFPEQPFQSKRCDPVEKDQDCSNMTTYTKVFGIDSTITYNVSCTPAGADMYDKYDDNVMRTTLNGMTHAMHLETSQTGYMPLKEAKMAVLLGSGKTDNGDDLIYTAQLWIGHKSVFTLEGELRGKYQPEADRLFAEILKTAKLKGTATPVDIDGNPIKPDSKASKAEKSKDNPDKK
jgi:hypothetical protein